MNALERRVRGELAEDRSNPDPNTWQKSAEGIVVADGTALCAWKRAPKEGRSHPDKGPNGTTGEYLCK
jgi:hypothetical protein